MDRVEDLRAQWHKASEKDKAEDALRALLELETLEPQEPRWSQRVGEAYRRVGRTPEAVDAFARAFERFFDRGFLPRAIAMAKLVKSLDAARGNLLEQSLSKEGPGVPPPMGLGRSLGRPSSPPPAPLAPVAVEEEPPAPVGDVAVRDKAVVKPPPLPAGDRPKPPRTPSVDGMASPFVATSASKAVKPAPLARAADAGSDEVRFDDAPDSHVEVLLSEFLSGKPAIVLADESDLELDDVDDEEEALPSTQRLSDPPPRDAYATMATFRLFASLSRQALVALADASELVEFVPGAMIIVRDERAFALYAIVSGTAKVIVAGSPEIRLKEGDIFGEASLLDEGKRQADVRAETPLMTLRIQKGPLDDVMKAHPEVENALFDLLARRLITNLMHTSQLFSAFEPSVRLELAQTFEVRRAKAGTLLAERGRRSDGLYVLLAGNVMAEPEAGIPTRIARGTAFGHASLLGKGSAEVTVRAATEAVLLRMPASGFAALAVHYPPALAHLSETAEEPLPISTRDL